MCVCVCVVYVHVFVMLCGASVCVWPLEVHVCDVLSVVLKYR